MNNYTNLNSCLIPAADHTFDLSTVILIRESFRLNIHNRRNLNSINLVLLDENLIQNLLALKKETFELLQTFKLNVNKPNNSTSDIGRFSNFEEFMNFVVTEQEILNSELWKLEIIFDYLQKLELQPSSSIREAEQPEHWSFVPKNLKQT